MQTIAILSSGGDAPGMNAAIRAATRGALSRHCRVLGVLRGFAGLIENDIVDLGQRSVSGVMHQGGTMLYTARSEEFRTPEGFGKALDTISRNNIDGLIVIGGDGTFRGALELSRHGVQVVGIPCTIDNDIGCSDYSIGFDTALNTVVAMVDRLRDTAQSHERCSLIEVMGRRSGNLAMSSGIATGSAVALVPEMRFDFEQDIVERIRVTRATGKRHFILVAAEGIYRQDGALFENSEQLSKAIAEATGLEVRTTILGHVQRGGSPTARDRIVATEMGFLASQLLAMERGNRVIAICDGSVCDMEIEQALAATRPFDFELYNMARAISS